MEKNNNNNNNNINNNNNNNNNHHHHNRERGLFNGDNNLVRTITHPPETRSTTNTNTNTTLVGTTPSDFVLKWGSSKRLRCMKVQGKDREGSSSGSRRAVRSDLNGSKEKDSGNASNGFVNLRNSPAHRVTRNSEGTIAAMKGGHSNGASDKKAHNNNNPNSNNNNNNHHTNNNNNNNINNGGVGSGSGSDTVHDSKKGGGTSSGSDAMPAVWPPKFVIALTNKEKEEDFYAFKGSKLPQRPKKRAKFVQRTLNLVSPGAWLCDLTLERYEVREKKISKKRPRGLKAMGNMESDSE